jgi:hypothetical protein
MGTPVRQGQIAGLCALALMLVTATSARAGDYTVHSCKEEVGTPVYATDGWKAIGRLTPDTIGDGCFRGGSLFARLPLGDYVSGTVVGWEFDAPAGTQIVGYRISRSVVVGKPSAGGAAPAYYLTWPGLDPNTDIREQCVQPSCSSLGRRDKAVPENVILSPTGMPGIPAVHLVVGCGGPAGAKCLASDAAPGTDPVRLDIHGAQITLRDGAPPAVAGLSGPLTEAGRTQTQTTTVTARGTDAGGGVAAFALEVDGKAVATAAAPGCQAAPYTSPTPCPADATQTLGLDTNTLGYGTHTARVIVTDVSGNATGSAPIALRVDNRRRVAYGATLSFSYRGRRGGGTRFSRLTAKRVPSGASITLTCSGGKKRGCPLKSKRIVKSAKTSTYPLLPALKRRTLRAPARLVVRITATDGSVQRRTLKIRRGKAPKQSTRCREGAAGARYGSCG